MFGLVLLAAAAPVSLSCMLDDRGAKVPMTVRLDEARGAVRYSIPATGRSVAARALFLRERITFDRFVLDRGTLAILREGESVTAVLDALPRETRGRCRPVAAAKAAVPRGKHGT